MTTINNKLPIQVKGHVHIEDDQGNVLLDKDNAIHPANMARVISRALAHEANSWIGSIAFGNGGTVTDAAYNIRYKTSNDGFPPDIAGWRSTLYNETYREVIDESSTKISSGVGATPIDDPIAIANSTSGPGVVSKDLGLISQTIITCYLNQNEPKSQYPTDLIGNPISGVTENTEAVFAFDEIGLFTTGAPLVATSGNQLVDVNTRKYDDITGLTNNADYVFSINVDGIQQDILVHTPITGSGGSGEILYSDLVQIINTQLVGATASINDANNLTYGYLKFTSNTTGVSSKIELLTPSTPIGNWLFDAIDSFVGFEVPVDGVDAGLDNNPNQPELEAERLLAHIVFSPIHKTNNRSIIIRYTLTVSVARSEQ